MKQAAAHQLARTSHAGQRSRFGEPIIEHVARVATAVPVAARPAAWLHDLIELCPITQGELRRQGLTDDELAALALLTHAPDDSYETYVGRIADAPGPAGDLARVVKLADLDDHLAHSMFPPDAPPYAWARRRLLTGQWLPLASSSPDQRAQLAPRRLGSSGRHGVSAALPDAIIPFG
jgi:hypothetical protein